MTKQEYRSLLGQLPIKNPTPQDMARFCPHLTEEEAVEAFTTGSGYVACPPLRIRGAFQILSYHKEWIEEIKVQGEINGERTQVITGKKNHPARLDWSYAGRTPASYVDGKSHGDVFSEYAHMDKAIKFAEDNWPDDLIVDPVWASAVTIYVQDPTDLVNDRYHKDCPRTKAVLYLMLNRDLNQIINDHSKSESELFDEAVAEMTLDICVWHELKGGRGGFTEFNCAHCASGLGLSGCSGCGYKFRDDHYRCGWATPLSRKMVAFLKESGHNFPRDPELAYTAEQQRFEDNKKAAVEFARRRASK